MKKLFLVLALFLLSITTISAIGYPGNKECVQRGYELVSKPGEDTLCLFPDGRSCPLLDFNGGECGTEFMTSDYCTAEGISVWDDNCCSGLVRYSPPFSVGQPVCRDLQYSITTTLFILRYPLIISMLVGILIFFGLRRHKKHKK